MNIYLLLLSLHSLMRWLVLIILLVTISISWVKYIRKMPFTKADNTLRIITTTIIHIQLLLGICLYTISPLVKYFLHNFNNAIRIREIRFFGMEHITMMLTAVIVISIGSIKSKRRADDSEKFKTLAIWFTIGLLIILGSIPWSFSPLIHRPNFRPL